MTAEQYEQIKAQVLEEQKAARRARAKERQRIREAANGIFLETEKEYLPKLVIKYSRKTGDYDCAYDCKCKIWAAERSALAILNERNIITAYLNGRAEEANAALRQLLDEILKN